MKNLLEMNTSEDLTILVVSSDELILCCIAPSDFFNLSSDHRAISENLSIRSSSLSKSAKRKRKRQVKRWKPIVDVNGVPHQYHEARDKCLALYDQPNTSQLSQVVAAVTPSFDSTKSNSISITKASKYPDPRTPPMP